MSPPDHGDDRASGEGTVAPTVTRAIVGFHRDEEGHWVAELGCGHTVHVRHDPPWVERPWVLHAAGRARRLGQLLRCTTCEAPQTPAADAG